MFTPDFYIDLFQSSKRMMTNKVYTDDRLNKVANNFIDAQTVFGKMIVNNTIEMLTYSVDSMSKVFYPQIEEKTVKAKTAKKSADTDINTQGE
jgi:ferric iron reductase protein FhuF